MSRSVVPNAPLAQSDGTELRQVCIQGFHGPGCARLRRLANKMKRQAIDESVQPIHF